MPDTKVILYSDFTDYYDHRLLNVSTPRPENTVTWQRLADKPTFPKWSQFQILQDLGYKVPTNGALFCTPNLQTCNQIVVYLDPYSHRGQGKELLHPANAVANNMGNLFCSEYIPTTQENTKYFHQNPTSYRVLKFGIQGYYIFQYTSNTDKWRSNVGEVEIKLLTKADDVLLKELMPKYHRKPILHELSPLIAIDIVKNINTGEYYAIDFNTAPQLKYTGLENAVNAYMVEQAILEFYESRK